VLAAFLIVSEMRRTLYHKVRTRAANVFCFQLDLFSGGCGCLAEVNHVDKFDKCMVGRSKNFTSKDVAKMIVP